MIDKINRLQLILERMNVLYKRALDLLDRERKGLIVLAFEQLFIDLQEKDEVLSAIRGLDKDRLRIQDQLAIVWDLDPAEVTLKRVGEELSTRDSIHRDAGFRLLRLRSELQTTLDLLKEKIEFNKGFIEKSIGNLRGLAEHLAASVTGRSPSNPKNTSNVYTGKAKYQAPQSGTGNLLEKRL
jgi:hypothetical protein